MEDTSMELTQTVERLAAVAEALAKTLEQAISRMAEQESLGRVSATVESTREEELLQRLEDAEAKIAILTANAGTRRTLTAGTATMLSKHGVAMDSMDASVIDGALGSLSVEQRIAVKAELLRAGLLG